MSTPGLRPVEMATEERLPKCIALERLRVEEVDRVTLERLTG